MKPILASLIAKEVAALNQALSRAGVDTKVVMVASMRKTAQGHVPTGYCAALEVDDDWDMRERFAPTTEREAEIAFGAAMDARGPAVIARGPVVIGLPARSADAAPAGRGVPTSC